MRTLSTLSVLCLVLAACECGKKPAAPALLHEGDACENDERCETGLCDAAPGFNPVCVRRCGDGCFTTEVCVQLTPNRFACQPDPRKLCAPCVADSDCPYPSDHCLVVNGEHVCGRDCAFDQNCPTGYRCVNGQGVDGQPKVQQCVPTNASCACLARGDFQQPCSTTNAFGTCLGIKQCDLVSNTVVCDARQAATETCNGRDDDCDGDTDEGQMDTMCGVGACARTVTACTDGGAAMCTPGNPTAELCNNLDDDCDGMTDEDFDLTSSSMNCGMCGRACVLPHATSNCSGSSCHVVTCDPGYANCNNQDPDGCESPTSADPANCGGCGMACTRPHSTPSCVNSMCQFVCAPGFVDLNMDPTDGCEYACTFTSSTDLPDYPGFVDANCDGIDGEINNAIFVSPMGNDMNVGSKSAPVRTISAALSAAVNVGKRDIYLAEGTYVGPLDLQGVSGMNVAGAYNAMDWHRATTQPVVLQGGNPALRIDGAQNVSVQAIRFDGADAGMPGESAYGAFINGSTGVSFTSIELRAGNGFDGTPGQAGTVGTPGTQGGNGNTGCANDPRPNANGLICNLILSFCSNGPGGAPGGASSCGFQGGSGGQSSLYNPSSTPNGTAGLAAPSGGLGGTGVPPGVTPAVGSIYFGEAGSGGMAGNNGAGATAGTFTSTGFVPTTGGAGTLGTAGRGGGGGGGGAGGLSNPIAIYSGFQCYAYGSAGGGGGGGGCPGQPATPGQGGGASIGIFMYASTLTTQNTIIRAGRGGNGGAGGQGGTGGTGGTGGVSQVDSDQGAATPGGNGGRGGDGGRGGHGGGGSGGSVFGVVKGGMGPNMSTWTSTGGIVTLGTVGSAGPSSGNPGVAGTSAVQTTF